MQRWICFNDALVRLVENGWNQIIQECLDSMAYPTVIVYEQGDMNAEDDPPFTYDLRTLSTWEREAGEADQNLFSDENIQE